MSIKINGRFSIRCDVCGDMHFSDYEGVDRMTTEKRLDKEVVRLDLGGCRCGYRILVYLDCLVIKQDEVKERIATST